MFCHHCSKPKNSVFANLSAMSARSHSPTNSVLSDDCVDAGEDYAEDGTVPSFDAEMHYLLHLQQQNAINLTLDLLTLKIGLTNLSSKLSWILQCLSFTRWKKCFVIGLNSRNEKRMS